MQLRELVQNNSVKGINTSKLQNAIDLLSGKSTPEIHSSTGNSVYPKNKNMNKSALGDKRPLIKNK